MAHIDVILTNYAVHKYRCDMSCLQPELMDNRCNARFCLCSANIRLIDIQMKRALASGVTSSPGLDVSVSLILLPNPGSGTYDTYRCT